MMDFAFRTPCQLLFQTHGARQLAALVATRMRRPVFVTDEGVMRLGLADDALESLRQAGLSILIYDGVIADPPAWTVRRAVEAARAHNADGVIGFGGGSCLDTAKLIAVLANSKQTLEDIYGVDNVRGDRLPLVLLPTTAGTGSEVTAISIVTTEDDRKLGIVADQLYADLAIIDASLTLTVPRSITAATGIDAMVHAIEAHTSKLKRNPISSALASQALTLMSANLIRACETPGDIKAREAMCLGATLAGQAFANAPVGAVHAMAYPLGARFHVPHGISNALMLGPVLKYNQPAAADLYAQLGPCVGVGEDADAFISRMVDLCEQSGVARRLTQVGVSQDDLPGMAEDVVANTRLMQNNPRPITYDQALEIYSSVL